MSETLSTRVRAFGCSIGIVSNGRDAFDMLERYVFPSMPREGMSAERADLSLRLEQSAGRIHLSVDGVVVRSSDQPQELAVHMINAIDEAVIQRMKGLHAVHAGAVMMKGRGLLLPGRTHAGKSSLVAELLRRGAGYFSDEYGLIDSEGRVHAYPRPLLMRNGRPKQLPMLPEDYDSSVVDAPAPVGWILSLEYQPGSEWEASAVPLSVAMLFLLRNTPHALAESPEMVGSFARAVSGAICLEGCRGEVGEAADRIQDLVEST
jgi:hypothetical protein